MLNLSKNDLSSTAKKRTISNYKSMSKNELINAINISKPNQQKIRRTFLNQWKKRSKRTSWNPQTKRFLNQKQKSKKFLMNQW